MATFPWMWYLSESSQQPQMAGPEKQPENLIELFDKLDREQFWGITSAQINNHSNSIGTIIHYQGQAPTITTHCPHCKKTI